MIEIVEGKHGKVNRVLWIYSKLIQGEMINKRDSSVSFNVSEKTIQRDLNDIRAYFNNNYQITGFKEVVYAHDKRGYVLSIKDDILRKEDILGITKILLESRAFCKEEIEHLINCMLLQINVIQRKYIKEIIENELFNYIPLQHNSSILTKIWDLSDIIRTKKILNITYIRADGLEVIRKIKPISIIFSEYYFYLIAYLDEFDTPTTYRIDRIKDYNPMEENFQIPYSERFEDGEFRKRIQFMYSGKLMKTRFEFRGGTLEAVMDRLPTSKIVGQAGDTFTIEAEVYGNGIIMWFLSQGSKIKVLSPDSLVEKMKEEINKLYNNYK